MAKKKKLLHLLLLKPLKSKLRLLPLLLLTLPLLLPLLLLLLKLLLPLLLLKLLLLLPLLLLPSKLYGSAKKAGPRVGFFLAPLWVHT